MIPSFSRLLAAAAMLLAAVQPRAEAVEKVAGYDTFRLVRTRNMFDPNRRPVRTEAPPVQRSSAPVRENRSSSLSLTGTMVTEGKSLAFFHGTRADYSKVLSVGDTIAGRKITSIKQAEVELEHGGKTSPLAVGSQVLIDGIASDVVAEEAPAPVATAPPDPGAPDAAGPTIPTAPAPGSPAPASTPATTTDKSDVLRRMMERRAQEMNK